MSVKSAQAPLAFRMQPQSLDEYVGQRKILGPGKLLRRMIEADQLSSIILFGPPGTGKSSLARVIAKQSKSHFEKLNAVTAGIADIKKVIELAQSPLMSQNHTILFIDEIHRFNKAQQDALLPYVEDGTLVLIGATTENPYFEVNKALISRSTLFKLESLSEDDLREIIARALSDPKRGFGLIDVDLKDEALDFIVQHSGGDARIALNALELALRSSQADTQGRITIDLQTASDSIQKPVLRYDRQGDGHYDNSSALIKSMRGSDPDASIFYLARALYAGEDIEFLARRIVICAAEDVGLANPQVLPLCMSAYEAVRRIGMPEARIILAEAVLMVACSPKSNTAYKAIDAALAALRDGDCGEVPLHLRNPVFSQMREDFDHGRGYKYAHDYPGHYVEQDYLPEKIRGRRFYESSPMGYERKIQLYLNELKRLSGESPDESSKPQ
ncbi:MAG: replication-associated recombination protein A [Eubacteriales bacterium]|nr:replication-associated recombination protein A [Eubacteriales bacterium]